MKREIVSSSADENCKFVKNNLFLITLILIIFILPAISAIEIKLSRDNYQPQETLQAEITGNFVSLRLENIQIYKSGVPRANPVISDLTYQNRIYYFYAILPKQEGNYSLKIEKTQYFDQGDLKEDSLIKDFTIKKTNQSSLSVNPGFIITNQDFSIKLKSLKDNQDVNINFEASSETKNISLIEGIENTVKFSISNLESMKTFLSINNYKIPVFITKAGNKTSIISKDLTFYPSELKSILYQRQTYFYEIKLFNIGDKNLTNIEISNNINGILIPDFISSIKTKSYARINFTITTGTSSEIISGEITAKFNNENITLPVYFKTTEKKEEVNISSTTSDLDCTEIGKKCASDEACNGAVRDSIQGECCLGNCIKISSSSSSSTGFYIGLVLFIIVLAIIVFLFFKIKKKQKPKTTEEILKERADEYRSRISGKEVNKKLDRV